MPPIEFDPAKDAANLRKHGLSLADARTLAWKEAVILPDQRREYGELRFRAYATMAGRLHMAAFTLRGCTLRIISLRRANERGTGVMEKPVRPGESIHPDDYEDIDIDDSDNPEWTEEDFARARPFKEVFPDLYEAMTRDTPTTSAPVRKAS